MARKSSSTRSKNKPKEIKFHFRHAIPDDIPYIILLERCALFSSSISDHSIPTQQYDSYNRTLKDYIIARPSSPTSSTPIAFIELVKHRPQKCPCEVCKGAVACGELGMWADIVAMVVGKDYTLYWRGLCRQLVLASQQWVVEEGAREMKVRVSGEAGQVFKELGFLSLGGVEGEEGVCEMRKCFYL
ncbi:hypothetical protein CC80DRAFT_492582 [Byssothecium circinans]|uniref:N-acetyltransferase domain-containing protein n=1 Tax=Byssothecium circinans TaxID=147558 RepID=A0A6A5TUM0_9PLEO|nr:hypothetical protein CC80DRAFT_492582 [Byssothecium circinans]